jgi:Ca2+-binding RTX toxin-like protein
MVRIVGFPKTKIIKSTTQTATTISSAALGLLIITLITTSGVLTAWASDLIGTSGPDTLVGTDYDDNIFGLGGNDAITDGLGSDRIFAGPGNDDIELQGTGRGMMKVKI